MGIASLNGMQSAVMEAGVERDLVLLSPTGSGKTLAFLLPLLPLLAAEEKTQAMVIVPSRELALQIESVFHSLGTGLKATCCYGGHPFQIERRSLEHPPVLLIGTPGRILDHLEKGNLSLQSVHTVILDEFDKALELKFVPEMRKIMSRLPRARRTVLTSATEAIEIPEFVRLHRPVRISCPAAPESAERLKIYRVRSPQKDRQACLYGLLGELEGESALVFCNRREAVEQVGQFLARMQVDCVYFHGGMEQADREQRLALFRNRTATVLVSTDLASRGLDIPEVRHVIHYHLPPDEKAFIHRNGRTARMHAGGAAYLLAGEADALPEYVSPEPEVFLLPEKARRPKPSEWATLAIRRGKRSKLSKKDIAGFLYRKGQMGKEDVGMIEVFESCALAAVRKSRKEELLPRIRGEKIKNLDARFSWVPGPLTGQADRHACRPAER